MRLLKANGKEMIGSVATSHSSAIAPRVPSPVMSAVASAPQASSMGQSVVSSRIRVDTLLDLAILEFRSASTGEVVRQYPTEPQIRAIQRAAQLEANKEQQVSAVQPQPAVSSTSRSSAISSSSVVTTNNASVPAGTAQPSGSAASASMGTSSDAGSSPAASAVTQSVIA